MDRKYLSDTTKLPLKRTQRHVNAFVKSIIQNSDEKIQSDFLMAYPIFKFKINVLKFWCRTYHNIHKKINKRKKDDDLNLSPQELKKKMENSIVFIKKNQKIDESTEGQLIEKKKNIIKFLIKGLALHCLASNDSDALKIIDLMEKYNEPHEYTNLLKIGIFDFRSSTAGRKKYRSVSSLTFSDISYDPHKVSPAAFPNSARPTINSQITDINDIDSEELALDLTQKHSRLIKSLSYHELILASLSNLYKVGNIGALYNEFDNLSYLVANEVLIRQKGKKNKIRAIIKFVDIAQKCYELGNYFALFAFISGMNLNPVERLKFLWDPDAEHTKLFKELEEVISPGGNYWNYRNKIKDQKRVVPYMGLFYLDLLKLSDTDLFVPETGVFNKENYDIVIKILNGFYSLELMDFNVKKHVSVYINFTRICKDDELLYEHSCELVKSKNKKINMIKNKGERKTKRKCSSLKAKKPVSEITPVGMVSSDIQKKRSDFQKSRLIGESYHRLYDIKPNKIVDGTDNIGDTESANKSGKLAFLKDHIKTWKNEHVLSWLKYIGMDKYWQNFKDEGIEGLSLVLLTEDHLLKYLNVKSLNDRLLIIHFVDEYKNKNKN